MFDIQYNLLRCCTDLIYDRCPPDNKAYFCMKSECEDDEMCVRCWQNYVYQIANGEIDYGITKPKPMSHL